MTATNGGYTIVAVKDQKTLLRKLRRDRELTLDELSMATGLNVSTLSRVERRMMRPTEATLNKLAKYFRVPASDLMKPEAVA